MDKETNFNRRQYERMLEKIERFESEKIEINSLIADLEALILALRDVPDDWRHQLQSTWAVLEDTYAVAQDDGKTVFAPQDLASINSAILKLKELIKRGVGH